MDEYKVIEPAFFRDGIYSTNFKILNNNEIKELLIKMINYCLNQLSAVFAEDLEHIKTLLEKYNKGEGNLAEIWDFVNTRLDVYREG